MTARLWPILAVGAAAVAWVQLPGVHPLARAWAVVLLIALPALMVAQGRALARLTTLPRTEAYVSSMVSLWGLAALTYAVARLSGYGNAELGLVAAPGVRTLLVAAALTVAGVAVLFLFRAMGVREPGIVRELMPVTTRERWLFVAVSVTAGLCEELVYRGFLIHVLHGGTGSLAMALLLSSGAFGVAHAYQQPVGALRAALLGLALSIPVVLEGTILPSVIAHAVIDILSGLWLARYLLRE